MKEELDITTKDLEIVKTIEDIVLEENLQELDIIKFPSKKLKTISTNVADFDEDHTGFLKNLLFTMKENNAIGISAPQVGVYKKIIIINIKEPIVLFNPELILHGDTETEFEEGVLSIPGYFYKIKRYDSISIAYQDDTGKRLMINATGLTAATIQHELDIINGKLFLDKYSVLKRIYTSKKIKKHIKKQVNENGSK